MTSFFIFFFWVLHFSFGESVETDLFEDIEDDVVETATTDAFGSLSLGHNLSTNNRTLRKGQWSLGTLYAGYGLTDNWTVGTSTFVTLQFEMFNLMSRYKIPLSSTQTLGFDVAYFKTFGGKAYQYKYCSEFQQVEESFVCTWESTSPVGYDGFLMEAISSKLTYSQQMSSRYRFNTTLSYFYYFDDRMPFSFRMDPANSDPFTVNLTSLNEIKLSEKLYLNLEGGFWGLNYEYLYYHTGISLGIQNKQGLVAIGVSTTFSPTFPKEQAKQFVSYDSRQSIHPEIQMQLFF